MHSLIVMGHGVMKLVVPCAVQVRLHYCPLPTRPTDPGLDFERRPSHMFHMSTAKTRRTNGINDFPESVSQKFAAFTADLLVAALGWSGSRCLCRRVEDWTSRRRMLQSSSHQFVAHFALEDCNTHVEHKFKNSAKNRQNTNSENHEVPKKHEVSTGKQNG